MSRRLWPLAALLLTACGAPSGPDGGGSDATAETGLDAELDAASEAGAETVADAGPEANPEAGIDAGPEPMAQETGAEPATETGIDAGPEAMIEAATPACPSPQGWCNSACTPPSVYNCGECGRACPGSASHALFVCSLRMGTGFGGYDCAITNCTNPAYRDCDGDPSNGCESMVTSCPARDR